MIILKQCIIIIIRSTTNKLIKIFAGSEVIMATPEHPFYEATNGWTLAGSFKKGMHFLLATGLSLSIDSIAAIDSTCTVYNCNVPITQTYFVGKNSVLAHNADICNKLFIEIMTKLGGEGYELTKVGLSKLLNEYKVLSKKSELNAIDELMKLTGNPINNGDLTSLLTYVKLNSLSHVSQRGRGGLKNEKK